jgi:hypothetical protein
MTVTLPKYSNLCLTMEGVAMAAIDPLTAGGVLPATAATDAVYVMFASAVVTRGRVPAATWSSVWYLLARINIGNVETFSPKIC